MSRICDLALPEHTRVLCNDDFSKGPIKGWAFVCENFTVTDWSVTAQWATDINNDLINVVSGLGINGSKDDAAPVTLDNPTPCGPTTIKIGNDETITLNCFSVNEANNDFFKVLDGREGYLALQLCSEDQVEMYIERLCMFSVSPANIPATDGELRRYVVTVTTRLSKGEFPELFAEPADIFD